MFNKREQYAGLSASSIHREHIFQNIAEIDRIHLNTLQIKDSSWFIYDKCLQGEAQRELTFEKTVSALKKIASENEETDTPSSPSLHLLHELRHHIRKALPTEELRKSEEKGIKREI